MAVRSVYAYNNDPDMKAVLTVLNQLATLANELKADHNALLTKLDADAGVTDTNYASQRTVAAADADTIYRLGG
jgi:hypothetical protein